MPTDFDLQGTITIAALSGSVRFDGPYDGEWYIRRAVFTKATAAGGEVVSVYIGSLDLSGLRDATKVTVIPAAIADEASPIRVPAYTPIFCGITGGVNGEVWQVTLQLEAPDLATEPGTTDWQGFGQPDSLLDEHGFPNQRRIPLGRR